LSDRCGLPNTNGWWASRQTEAGQRLEASYRRSAERCPQCSAPGTGSRPPGLSTPSGSSGRWAAPTPAPAAQVVDDPFRTHPHSRPMTMGPVQITTGCRSLSQMPAIWPLRNAHLRTSLLARTCSATSRTVSIGSVNLSLLGSPQCSGTLRRVKNRCKA
jgi:hypothetical protein